MSEMEMVCDSLSETEDVVIHELLGHLANKWSLWTLGILAHAGRPLRFSRVLEGITSLGMDLLEQVQPLWLWVAGKVAAFQAARERYDGYAHGGMLEHNEQPALAVQTR